MYGLIAQRTDGREYDPSLDVSRSGSAGLVVIEGQSGHSKDLRHSHRTLGSRLGSTTQLKRQNRDTIRNRCPGESLNASLNGNRHRRQFGSRRETKLCRPEHQLTTTITQP